MTNEDVIDLFAKVNVGTKVVVLPRGAKRTPQMVAAPNRRVTTVTLNSQPLSPQRVSVGIY